DGVVSTLNPSNGDVVKFTIQMKSSDNKSGLSYMFTTSKFDRRNTNKRLMRPYDHTDNVDFFVFEAVAPHLQNNFYIIPMQQLIDNRIIRTITQNGSMGLTLPSPD